MDTSDPKDVAAASKRAKWLNHREREDLRWVLSDSRGRRYLAKLMSACGLYAGIPRGAERRDEAIGKRIVALAIRSDVLRVTPEALHLMEQELALEPEFGVGDAEEPEPPA